MRDALDHLTFFPDQDFVHYLQAFHAMSDQQHRPAASGLQDVDHQFVRQLVLKVGGGLVQDQDRKVCQ